MKNIMLLLITASFTQSTHSQSLTATGTVINGNNKPIAGALVSEFKSTTASATYTDSLGVFTLPVSPFPKLSISSRGYNDTLINVVDKKNIIVVLSAAKVARRVDEAASSRTDDPPLINKNLLQDAVSTQSGVNNSYVYGGGTRNYTGSLMPVFTHKEETEGSRYLFREWVHGSVTNIDNSVFDNSAYLYNYDKMGGGLLLTTDKRSAIEADKDKVKLFTIYIVDKDSAVVYENVPAIDNSHYAQLISAGSKYKIYKLTKTKFIKSNYHTDGIASSGNPYDEYIDEYIYFALNVVTNQMQKLSLKKKAIKEAFASDREKVSLFLSNSNNDKIDDAFLKRLGNLLNN